MPFSQRTSVCWIVTEPVGGGQLLEPLSDDEGGNDSDDEPLDSLLLGGSLLGGSLLDDDSLEDDSLDDDSLDELLLLEEDDSEDDDEDELDEELEDEELLDELDELDEELLEELELDDDELDDDEELDEPRQGSPSTSTSHLQLSAKCFAAPYVPAGAKSAVSQPQSPLDEVFGRQKSGQTTPSESWTVNVSGTGVQVSVDGSNNTSCASAESQR